MDETTDIVERLRGVARQYQGDNAARELPYVPDEWLTEAADEIERLRAMVGKDPRGAGLRYVRVPQDERDV